MGLGSTSVSYWNCWEIGALLTSLNNSIFLNRIMSQHSSINNSVLRILNWSFRSASGSMYGLSSSSSYPIFIHLSFIMIYEGENSNEQIIFHTDSLPSQLLGFSSPTLPVFLPRPFSSHPPPPTPSCPSSPTHPHHLFPSTLPHLDVSQVCVSQVPSPLNWLFLLGSVLGTSLTSSHNLQRDKQVVTLALMVQQKKLQTQTRL